MERHQNNIDNLFKDALGDYTEVPPPVVWDALDKRLDGDRDKRRGFFRWYWVALLLIGITLGAAVITKTPAGLFSYFGDEKNPATIAEKTSQTTVHVTVIANKPTPSETIASANATNENVKKHLHRTSSINNINANKQETLNTQNNQQSENKVVSSGIGTESNSATQSTPSTEKHISFKKYEADAPAVVQTRQHNIVITQAEPPKPINDNEQAIQEPQQTETVVAGKPVIAENEEKAPEVNKYAGVIQKPTIAAAKVIAVSASLPAGNTVKETVAKNGKTEKSASKPIVQGTLNKTEHQKKQARDTSIAVISKKGKLSEHTSTKAKLKSFKEKTNKKLSVAANTPSTPSVKKVAKKAAAHIAIGKTDNKAIVVKPEVKQLVNKASEKSFMAAKKTSHKTMPDSRANSKAVSQPAQTTYSSGNVTMPTNATQPIAAIAPKKPEPMATFKTDTNAIHKTSSSGIVTNNGNTNSVAPPDSNSLSKVNFGKFEAGIKVGYEGAMTSSAAKKAVVSPYLQYNISSKLSIMTQPSLNASHVSAQSLSGTQSFYKVNNDGKYSMDSVLVLVAPSGDTIWRRNYNYTQSHDSIVKSYTSGGSFVQIELPILAKYSISKKLSVYGGLVLDYSRLVGIQEKTYTSSPIVKTGSAFTVGTQASTPPPIDSVISYNGTPISNYKGPLYPSEQKDQFSFGYMFGVSYEFRKRWLIDALIHQSFVKPDVQGGYDINKPYSAPYFRITLGYKLIPW